MNISTSDICFASALKVHGFKLDSIEKNGNRGVWHFSDVTDEFISEYDLGNSSVEPVVFHQCIRTLTASIRRLP